MFGLHSKPAFRGWLIRFLRGLRIALPEMANHQRVTNRPSADPPQKQGVCGRMFHKALTYSRMQIINPQTPCIVLKQVYLKFGESAEYGYLHNNRLLADEKTPSHISPSLFKHLLSISSDTAGDCSQEYKSGRQPLLCIG